MGANYRILKFTKNPLSKVDFQDIYDIIKTYKENVFERRLIFYG
jgi:hypothetical protein